MIAVNQYLAFVFWERDYDSGPEGGWSDFVGACDSVKAAREAVEDNWEQGDCYQIVDLATLKVIEEGDVSKAGAVSLVERDRRRETLDQSRALGSIGAKPAAPFVKLGEALQYGPYVIRKGQL